MITLYLLQEFCDAVLHNYSFPHPIDLKGRVTSYKLYKADGFTFIHIMFEYSWVNFVRLDVYYEWFNGRRDSKLESIGI